MLTSPRSEPVGGPRYGLARDYWLAVASGALLALSFPKLGHPAFGWIALTPLLVALSSESRIPNPKSHPFMLGLVAGLIYFTGTLYWITHVMLTYGGFEAWAGPALAFVIAALLNAALVAYLALFPAIFALIVRRLVIVFGWRGLMASPIVWVATELGRTHLFGGFPWALLGYSQVTVLPVAQLASLFGVYGVSALVAGVSAVAARATWRSVSAMASILAVVAVWGSLRAANGELTRDGEPIRVGLIQGNVDQPDKMNPARAAAILRDYLAMTRQAIGRGAGLVIWPEASYPFIYFENTREAERVRAIAREAKVPILLGSDQVTVGPGGVANAYYNSAFLVRSDGTTGGAYRKMHLVPFGEYVPLRRLFFFAGPLVQAVGPGFAAGDSPDLLPVDGHRVSAAICYEIVYPDLVRRFVAGGSELLTTITNDAWFGRTSAPYQHFAQASMRAIEDGRYLVRSANTGISGIVDPYGRVLSESAIYEPAVIVGDARFLSGTTLYVRHGDVFAYGSVLATVAMLLLARKRGRTPLQ